jgi:hypothetical protein
MPGRFKSENVTDTQEAFMVGLTDQRVANLWAVADDWADLKPETKEFLRDASPDDIKQLENSIRFIAASRLMGKVMWWAGAAIFAIVMGGFTMWERVQAFFHHKN